MLSASTAGWIRVFFLLLLFASPTLVFAQIPILVPENCRGANAAKACGVCDVAQLAQNVLNAGIYIAVFLSALLFAWAGWLHITAGGNESKVGEARKIFWHVLVGLMLLLGAWLIVDVIMKLLVKQGGQFGPWNAVC